MAQVSPCLPGPHRDASNIHFLCQDYWPGERYLDPPEPCGHPSPLFKPRINNKTVGGKEKLRIRAFHNKSLQLAKYSTECETAVPSLQHGTE